MAKKTVQAKKRAQETPPSSPSVAEPDYVTVNGQCLPPGSASWSPLIVDQWCAYHNRGYGAYHHKRAWIEKVFGANFQWHRWNERRLKSLCDYNYVTWMAPGSAGKTSDAAMFALQWWLEAPFFSAVIVCSTTMKMLRKRIWGQVARFHTMMNPELGYKGELLDTEMIVRHAKGDSVNGIFGLAVEEGPTEEIVNNLIGVHTHRVFLILDEMQGVREAIMKALPNLAKNPVSKFLGMGNPDSILTLLGRESEPVNGWASVVRAETESWPTHGGPMQGGGVCHFFDGRKSPADDSPAERKRLHWLINADWIAAHLRAVRGNANDPSYWSQCVGWPPPMGIDSTVLDESIVVKFQLRENMAWNRDYLNVAALDPAFGGGDRKVLQFGRLGQVVADGGLRWRLQCMDWIDIPIDADGEEPIHYQIARFVIAECQKRSIAPQRFALDSSGEGGGLAAILQTEWGEVVGVEFGGRASERMVSENDPRSCRDVYADMSAELNMSVREFALGDNLRGLSPESVGQFCARKTMFKNRKYFVEPKSASTNWSKGFKQRMGVSPDHADAVAILVELCRRLGAVASSPMTTSGVIVADTQWEDELTKTANDYDESNYATSEGWL